MTTSAPGSGDPHAASELTVADRERIGTIIAPLLALPGALLPILHAIQNSFGFVPPASVPIIADALNLSRAEVHGVISFYHHFRSVAPGRHVLKLCRAEACQAMGARTLEAHLRERLGIDFGQTTADGRLTLEPVYCLGNCACAPSAMLDETVHGRLSAERIDRLIDACGEGT